MSYWKIFISFMLLLLGQFFVWLQVYGSSKWTNFGLNGKYLFFTLLAGMPIAYIIMLGAKFGREGFGENWPVRIMTFIAGVLIFSVMTNVFLGEGVTTKTWISLILMAAVVGVQLFVK